MEAIFRALPNKGKLTFYNSFDLERYCMEKEGVEQVITIKDASKLSEKWRMYAFLFGPVMAAAVVAYTRAGYEGVDKVKARYMLEAELCKAEVYNIKTGKTEIYIESMSGMGKARLHKFLTDVLFYLETEFQQEVPDSQEWKIKRDTGREYKTVKSEPKDPYLD